MGDPKRQRKKRHRPRHPRRRDRLIEEAMLAGEYGLRNRREIRKAKELLREIRTRARQLLALPPEEAEERAKVLLAKLHKMGLITKPDATLDDILSLTVRDILERRLQTVVFRLGLARSIREARQMIVHRHIMVNGNVVNSPSYLVKIDDKVEFKPTSVFAKRMKTEEGEAS